MELNFKPNLKKEIISSLIFFPILIIFIFGGLYAINFLPQKIKFIIGTVLFIIGVISLFGIIIHWGYIKNTKYRIDEEYVSQNRLFIQEVKKDIPFIEITNIDFKIGFFWDKIFKTGTILISTAGSSRPDLVLNSINRVEEIYTQLNSQLKLSKSININENGDFTEDKTQESKLEKRIKPDTGTYLIINIISLIGSAIFLVIYFYLDSLTETTSNNSILIWILGFSLLKGLGGSTIGYLAYKKKYYDFYSDKLEYYDGFFTLNKSTIPYERITNIDENRSLLDRIFGVSKIAIETAGSSGSEINITYIKNGDAIVTELKEVLKKNGRN